MSNFTAPASTYELDTTYAPRRASATVTVLGADGQPLANTPVTVAQLQHEFLFGNIGFELVDWINNYQFSKDNPDRPGRRHNLALDPEYDEKLAQRWLEVFNQATLPFYWGSFEPFEGQTRTVELQNAARWFRERGVVPKGHPLVWHTVQPSWLMDKPAAEVPGLLRNRVKREVTDFTGLVDIWDAINEVVIMPVFANGDNAITPLARQVGRIDMVRRAFEDAREANPNITLILNDFDMSTAYECLIEGVLEAGIQIDKLGLQSHQHKGYWGKEWTENVLDRFGRYNIPIHFTETTLLSGDVMPPEFIDLNDYKVEDWPSTPEGEARQADEIEEWYRTLASHPLVEAITYWGMGDRAMWLGAPGGLLRKDGSPKPAFERLRELIKDEWWYKPTTVVTDANGQVTVSGWKGAYQITAPDGAVTGVTLS
ncbi:MAG: endo-1,4-beta-xylanase [Cellulomonadaceae bacterium]|nr:endo-1,4-beta-xylanase [Cellulomonadaceae bacterium]